MSTSRESDEAPDADLGTSLRSAMVEHMKEQGWLRSDEVAAALTRVPREMFTPGTPLETVYAAETVVITKRDEHGAPMSSVSAPRIQALMLQQAHLYPGMKVLEIGSGGYNAALIAELVGPGGEVTTVDIDAEVVGRARECLTAAGYERVRVVLADAEHGVPEFAPYDRIIVTVGAWDIPPAWIDQLTDDGMIVVPLRMRGLTRSVAFIRDGIRLVSSDHEMCGFVPMQGIGARAEQVVELHGEDVHLRVDEAQALDTDGLREALKGARVERWSGVTVGPMESFDGLDMWLMSAADSFALLTATSDAIDDGLVGPVAVAGTKAIVSGTTLAYRVKPRALDVKRTRFEFGVLAHGPDADRLAKYFIDLIKAWDREHRHGPGSQLTAIPVSASPRDFPAGRLIDKQHVQVVISWSRHGGGNGP